ncbi:MAG TPA: CHRD domain-containing protein [Burkholderiales bacterium]|nr:CHRD domain-containing protein [Burkholderiales bacterium]
MKKFAIKLFVLGMLFGAGSAQADFLFRAQLTSDQETPVTPPFQGTSGVAFFVLNDAMTQLSYVLDTTGLDFRLINPATGISNVPAPPGDNLTDNVTRIHIHTAPLGVAGPIVFGQVDTLVNSGPPNGANDTVNDEDDLTVDIANGVIFGVWDANEGANNSPGNFLAAQLANLFGHNLYINVHTSDFPGGEIRGQIVRVFGIPEPRSLALIVCALGAIYLVRRRVTKAEARI